MAVETRQCARLIKRNKKHKVRKGVTIYQNDLGWVKIRTDEGKDQWLTSVDQMLTLIDRWLLQGYEWDGKCALPTAITSRLDVSDDAE